MSEQIYYKTWKLNKMSEEYYFIIFNEFVDSGILKEISPGGLKLYIFFGLNSFYKFGKAYYKQSIKEIAQYFNKSERTISYWIKNLEELKLIERKKEDYKDVSNTTLLPYGNEQDILENMSYYEWIKLKRNKNDLFFVIFEDFKNKRFLNEISGEALKLYVFFGVYSKYDTGISWYSIPKISSYFERSERTISYWIKELIDLNLIYRKQLQINQSSRTYLLRY